MDSKLVALVVGISLGLVESVPAQSWKQPNRQREIVARSTTGWTSIGAGAGFGLGLYIGLAAFDDALNSDRKVWTSAAIGAAVGVLAGYLVARIRHHDRGHTVPAAPADRETHLPEIEPTFARAAPISIVANQPDCVEAGIGSAAAERPASESQW